MSQVTKKTEELAGLEKRIGQEIPVDTVGYDDFSELRHELTEASFVGAERKNPCKCLIALIIKREFKGRFVEAIVYPRKIRVADVAAIQADGRVFLFQVRTRVPIAALYDGNTPDQELYGEVLIICPTPMSSRQGYVAPGNGKPRLQRSNVGIVKNKVNQGLKKLIEQSRDWRKNWVGQTS
jgi:hypothetical protein